MNRRKLLVLLALACGFAPAAHAAWPERPVKIIVALPPGSGADTTARFIARHLAQALGQPFIVENRPGANNIIAAKAVADSPPDGYTMFVASNSPMVTNAAVFRRLPYDPVNDFVPVASLAKLPMVLVVSANSPYRTLQQLVAAAKAAPGKLNYAAGTPTYQVATELFHERNGIRSAPVPYKGTAPAVTDTAAGAVDYTVAEVSSVLPLVRAGKLRALAAASAQRLRELPEVPTFDEAGTKRFEAAAWTGVFFPAKVPPAIVQRVAEIVRTSISGPEGTAFVEALGGTVFTGTQEQFREFLAAEIEATRRIVRDANIPVE